MNNGELLGNKIRDRYKYTQIRVVKAGVQCMERNKTETEMVVCFAVSEQDTLNAFNGSTACDCSFGTHHVIT